MFKNIKKVLAFTIACVIVTTSLFTNIGFKANAAVNCAARNTIYWDGVIANGIANGTGTQADPYVIKTADELAWLVKQNADVSKGKYFEIDETIGTIILQPESRAQAVTRQTSASLVKAYFEAIAASAKVWPSTGSDQSSFCGELDGNGVTIYGLYQRSSDNAGLFSNVDAGAAIKNIGLKNSYLVSTDGNHQVGGIAAASNSADYGAESDGAIWFNGCVVANNYMYNASTSNDNTGVIIGASSDVVYIDNCIVYGNNATYETSNTPINTTTNQDPDWKSHPEDYKLLAFTFDDGPSANMPRYVDLFSLYEGTGTFFVRGISIKDDSSYSAMQSAINAGWDIGNHGDQHLVATTGGTGGGEATYDQIKADIDNLTAKLESNLKTRDGAPYKVKFYRPPNIKPTANTFKICAEENLAVVWLKYDALDWASNKTYDDRYNVFKNGIGTWEDGDVILCHEIGVVGAEDTYKILEELLPEFYEAGYRFCSISELMQMRGITQSQLSGKLETASNNNGMVTNILEVARDKTAPIWGSANNNVIVSDNLVKPEGLEMVNDDTETPYYYNMIRNSIIFDTPAFNYAQNQTSRFNDTKCYSTVLANIAFENYTLPNGETFLPSEEQIKVVSDLADAELSDAFVKTETYPELKTFHDDVFTAVDNGDGTHSTACSCGKVTGVTTTHSYTNETCDTCGALCPHTNKHDTVKENDVASTCTQKGSYENVVYCIDCNGEVSRETIAVEIIPDNHVFGDDNTCDFCQFIRNPIKSGDVNEDSNINNKDLGLLMQYLNAWDVEINTDTADVNADGNINNKDYGLLMQFLNNWDIELK